jgi:hypothetical protein
MPGANGGLGEYYSERDTRAVLTGDGGEWGIGAQP